MASRKKRRNYSKKNYQKRVRGNIRKNNRKRKRVNKAKSDKKYFSSMLKSLRPKKGHNYGRSGKPLLLILLLTAFLSAINFGTNYSDPSKDYEIFKKVC